MPRGSWRDRLARLRRAVQGFDESHAAPALRTIASRLRTVPDRAKKVFDHRLVTGDVGDDWRGGGRVRAGRSTREVGPRGAEIGGSDPILLDHDRAFGAGEFDLPGVTGEGGGGGFEGRERAVYELQRGHECVLDFDLVNGRGLPREDAFHIAPQP